MEHCWTTYHILLLKKWWQNARVLRLQVKQSWKVVNRNNREQLAPRFIVYLWLKITSKLPTNFANDPEASEVDDRTNERTVVLVYRGMPHWHIALSNPRTNSFTWIPVISSAWCGCSWQNRCEVDGGTNERTVCILKVYTGMPDNNPTFTSVLT